MKILVCGGRAFHDHRKLFEVLDSIPNITHLVHGGATGADALAGQWAVERRIPCDVYHANWRSYGRAAGPIRNAQMLREAKPDLVLAFPGGRGTANMVELAEKAGVKVRKL
jgi:hypothetical protein